VVSALLHMLDRAARSVGAGIFALALLTPYLNGFVFLLQADTPSCGMSCCKTAKDACHRSRLGDPHKGGWTSEPECPSGCGQSIGLPGSPWFGLSAGGFLVGPILQESSFLRSSYSAWLRPGIAFSLFERPPPSLG
jgi:hypothetical protein